MVFISSITQVLPIVSPELPTTTPGFFGVFYGGQLQHDPHCPSLRGLFAGCNTPTYLGLRGLEVGGQKKECSLFAPKKNVAPRQSHGPKCPCQRVVWRCHLLPLPPRWPARMRRCRLLPPGVPWPSRMHGIGLQGTLGRFLDTVGSAKYLQPLRVRLQLLCLTP